MILYIHVVVSITFPRGRRGGGWWYSGWGIFRAPILNELLRELQGNMSVQCNLIYPARTSIVHRQTNTLLCMYRVWQHLSLIVLTYS